MDVDSDAQISTVYLPTHQVDLGSPKPVKIQQRSVSDLRRKHYLQSPPTYASTTQHPSSERGYQMIREAKDEGYVNVLRNDLIKARLMISRLEKEVKKPHLESQIASLK